MCILSSQVFLRIFTSFNTLNMVWYSSCYLLFLFFLSVLGLLLSFLSHTLLHLFNILTVFYNCILSSAIINGLYLFSKMEGSTIQNHLYLMEFLNQRGTGVFSCYILRAGGRCMRNLPIHKMAAMAGSLGL